MFTGIIAAIGRVSVANEAGAGELVFNLETPFDDAVLGESIAVNGTCLTVAEMPGKGVLRFHASSETLNKTNLGSLKTGSIVNLERALRFSDRLSGHLVQGHVDGLGRLTAVRQTGDCQELTVELPKEFLRYVIPKGSIAIDGISLTVNSIENNSIKLMIIPHTWEHTTLQDKREGQAFNIELDMIAKYLDKLKEG